MREDRLVVEGEVVECQRAATFVVLADVGGNKMRAICRIAGRLRDRSIKITLGDRVRCELSPWSPNRGRIVFRLSGARFVPPLDGSP